MVEADKDAGKTDCLSDTDHKAYWRSDATARQAKLRALYDGRDPADPYATSRDYNARELEIAAIANFLPSGHVLDLGCGNGYTLIAVSLRCGDGGRFVGVDFSEKLIGGARTLLDRAGVKQGPQFVCTDAIVYLASTAAESLDGVLSERFLLNMPDPETQRHVIRDVFRVLRHGGRFLMCEGSMEGFRNLNALRKSVGLPEIEETSADNLSAIRFEDREIEDFVTREVGFRLVDKLGFSTYFAITRALHPLLSAPEPPRFRSKINDLARQVQLGLPFAAGLGSNVIWVLEKP